MKPPAFQFYPDDFLAGTFQFTDEECGQYIRCLCHQWSIGALSEDDLHGMTRGGKISEKVRKKFVLGADGKYRNARLEHERKKQKQFRDNKKQAGKAGANKRWQTHVSANGKPIAEGMANDSSPSPSPFPSPIDQQTNNKPTLAQVLAVCDLRGIPKAEGELFWNHFEASGWIDKNGHRIINWQAKLATWTANARAKPAEQAHHGNRNGGISPSTQAILDTKKLERIEKRIKDIRDSVEGHQTMDGMDRDELRDLKKQSKELKRTLGMPV